MIPKVGDFFMIDLGLGGQGPASRGCFPGGHPCALGVVRSGAIDQAESRNKV